eukprot:ANDGO_07757.mRNA.1 hypothetical protein
MNITGFQQLVLPQNRVLLYQKGGTSLRLCSFPDASCQGPSSIALIPADYKILTGISITGQPEKVALILATCTSSTCKSYATICNASLSACSPMAYIMQNPGQSVFLGVHDPYQNVLIVSIMSSGVFQYFYHFYVPLDAQGNIPPAVSAQSIMGLSLNRQIFPSLQIVPVRGYWYIGYSISASMQISLGTSNDLGSTWSYQTTTCDDSFALTGIYCGSVVPNKNMLKVSCPHNGDPSMCIYAALNSGYLFRINLLTAQFSVLSPQYLRGFDVFSDVSSVSGSSPRKFLATSLATLATVPSPSCRTNIWHSVDNFESVANVTAAVLPSAAVSSCILDMISTSSASSNMTFMVTYLRGETTLWFSTDFSDYVPVILKSWAPAVSIGLSNFSNPFENQFHHGFMVKYPSYDCNMRRQFVLAGHWTVVWCDAETELFGASSTVLQYGFSCSRGFSMFPDLIFGATMERITRWGESSALTYLFTAMRASENVFPAVKVFTGPGVMLSQCNLTTTPHESDWVAPQQSLVHDSINGVIWLAYNSFSNSSGWTATLKVGHCYHNGSSDFLSRSVPTSAPGYGPLTQICAVYAHDAVGSILAVFRTANAVAPFSACHLIYMSTDAGLHFNGTRAGWNPFPFPMCGPKNLDRMSCSQDPDTAFKCIAAFRDSSQTLYWMDLKTGDFGPSYLPPGISQTNTSIDATISFATNGLVFVSISIWKLDRAGRRSLFVGSQNLVSSDYGVSFGLAETYFSSLGMVFPFSPLSWMNSSVFSLPLSSDTGDLLLALGHPEASLDSGSQPSLLSVVYSANALGEPDFNFSQARPSLGLNISVPGVVGNTFYFGFPYYITWTISNSEAPAFPLVDSFTLSLVSSSDQLLGRIVTSLKMSLNAERAQSTTFTMQIYNAVLGGFSVSPGQVFCFQVSLDGTSQSAKSTLLVATPYLSLPGISETTMLTSALYATQTLLYAGGFPDGTTVTPSLTFHSLCNSTALRRIVAGYEQNIGGPYPPTSLSLFLPCLTYQQDFNDSTKFQIQLRTNQNPPFVYNSSQFMMARCIRLSFLSPVDGAYYVVNDSVLVSWTVSGSLLPTDTGSLVDLSTGNFLAKHFSLNSSSTGSFSWKIPISFQGMTVQLKFIFDSTGAEFLGPSFVVQRLAKSLDVLYPTYLSQFPYGIQDLQISWISSGLDASDYISVIQLLCSGSSGEPPVVASQVPCLNGYVVVSTGPSYGQCYFRLTVPSLLLSFVYSDVFSISKSLPTNIRLTVPLPNSTWTVTSGESSFLVSWITENTGPSTVALHLECRSRGLNILLGSGYDGSLSTSAVDTFLSSFTVGLPDDIYGCSIVADLSDMMGTVLATSTSPLYVQVSSDSGPSSISLILLSPSSVASQSVAWIAESVGYVSWGSDGMGLSDRVAVYVQDTQSGTMTLLTDGDGVLVLQGWAQVWIPSALGGSAVRIVLVVSSYSIATPATDSALISVLSAQSASVIVLPAPTVASAALQTISEVLVMFGGPPGGIDIPLSRVQFTLFRGTSCGQQKVLSSRSTAVIPGPIVFPLQKENQNFEYSVAAVLYAASESVPSSSPSQCLGVINAPTQRSYPFQLSIQYPLDGAVLSYPATANTFLVSVSWTVTALVPGTEMPLSNVIWKVSLLSWSLEVLAVTTMTSSASSMSGTLQTVCNVPGAAAPNVKLMKIESTSLPTVFQPLLVSVEMIPLIIVHSLSGLAPSSLDALAAVDDNGNMLGLPAGCLDHSSFQPSVSMDVQPNANPDRSVSKLVFQVSISLSQSAPFGPSEALQALISPLSATLPLPSTSTNCSLMSWTVVATYDGYSAIISSSDFFISECSIVSLIIRPEMVRSLIRTDFSANVRSTASSSITFAVEGKHLESQAPNDGGSSGSESPVVGIVVGVIVAVVVLVLAVVGGIIFKKRRSAQNRQLNPDVSSQMTQELIAAHSDNDNL